MAWAETGRKGETWQGPAERRQAHVLSPLPAACAHTLCSYNSPDSHSFCEPAPTYQLTCNLGPPCSVDGIFCTCNHDVCSSSPTPTPTPTPTPVPCPVTLPQLCPNGPPADPCTWDNPDGPDGCGPLFERNGSCCVFVGLPTPTPTPACGEIGTPCASDYDCCTTSGLHCNYYASFCMGNSGCTNAHEMDECSASGGVPRPNSRETAFVTTAAIRVVP